MTDMEAYGRDPSMTMPPAFEALATALPELVSELSRRDPAVRAQAARHEGMRINVSAREERASSIAPEAGVVFSGARGDVAIERSVGSLDRDAASEAAHVFASDLGPATGPRVSVASASDRFRTRMERDPRGVAFEEKFDLLRGIKDALMRSDERAVNAAVNYFERRELSLVVDSSGVRAQDITRLSLMAVLFLAGEDGVRYAYDNVGGTVGFEAMKFGDEKVEALRDLARMLVSAKAPEPGMYDLVCAPDASGVIAHEAFGHGVEVDMYLKGRARSKDFLGKRVGSELVDLFDDPTVPGAYGSYFFDDQGFPAERVHIVENGVFVRGLADGVAAAATGHPRSASGRRESVHRKVYSRMSNTFFGRGQTPVDDLIASVDDGLFVARILDGMEDPKGWGMQVRLLCGRRIRRGRLTDEYYTPVGVTGYVPDVLASVRAVADDFELDTGFCGKGYKETVPVSSGGPTILARARVA